MSPKIHAFKHNEGRWNTYQAMWVPVALLNGFFATFELTFGMLLDKLAAKLSIEHMLPFIFFPIMQPTNWHFFLHCLWGSLLRTMIVIGLTLFDMGYF